MKIKRLLLWVYLVVESIMVGLVTALAVITIITTMIYLCLSNSTFLTKP